MQICFVMTDQIYDQASIDEDSVKKNKGDEDKNTTDTTEESIDETNNNTPLAERPDWYVVANKCFEHTLKLNINPVSFVGRKNHNPYSNIPKCADKTVELEVCLLKFST